MSGNIVTILDAVNRGKDFFAKKGIDSPRLTIELILCKVLRLDRVMLYARFDQPLNDGELSEIREMTLRRSKREPLQYIIGETEFYNSLIKVNSSVLIPRPETEQLVSEIISDYSDKESPREIMDIGTGSGCAGIALAKEYPTAKVFGIDISRPALETAKSNAELNHTANIEFFKYDILKSVPSKSFDLIFSNPPYIPSRDTAELEPEVKDFEPVSALTDNSDGLTFYKRFAEIFPDIIAPGGSFYLEFGYGQARDIAALFADKGFVTEIRKDFAGIERFCVGRREA